MYRSSHLVSGPQVLVLLLTLTQSFPLSIQSLNEMSVLQTLQRELLRQNLELPLIRRQLLTSQNTHRLFHENNDRLNFFWEEKPEQYVNTCAVCKCPPGEFLRCCSLTDTSSPPPSPAPDGERSWWPQLLREERSDTRFHEIDRGIID